LTVMLAVAAVVAIFSLIVLSRRVETVNVRTWQVFSALNLPKVAER
jgi:hypothetical protein